MLFANNGILRLYLNRNEPKTGGSTQCWNFRTIYGAMGARNREGIGNRLYRLAESISELFKGAQA
jgi:hypothetical protein